MHRLHLCHTGGLKDERPTSNVQRRTSNNDVATLLNLISFVFVQSDVKPWMAISVSFQPLDPAQGREPVERPF